METSGKDWSTLLLCCMIFGGFGGHCFYAGRMARGQTILLTCGGFGILVFMDFIAILKGEFKDGNGLVIQRPASVTNALAWAIGIGWFIFGIITIVVAVRMSVFLGNLLKI